MSTENVHSPVFAKSLKSFLLVSGIISLLFGIVILVWPARTAEVVTLVLATYAVVGGIVYIALAVIEKGLSGLARVGQALVGLLFVAAGVIAFMNPPAAAASLVTIVVIFIGAAWFVEGIAALTTLKFAGSKGWTIFFAIVSILAGIMIMIAPLFAASFFLLYLGITLVVIGIFQIIRALTTRTYA